MFLIWLFTTQRRLWDRADSRSGSFFIDQRENARVRLKIQGEEQELLLVYFRLRESQRISMLRFYENCFLSTLETVDGGEGDGGGVSGGSRPVSGDGDGVAEQE